MATRSRTRTGARAAATIETPAAVPTSASVPVVVEGRPVADAQPDEANKERVEFMRNFDAINDFNQMATNIQTRIADSGVGYYDDNTANKKYFARFGEDDVVTPLGTPMVQVRRIPFPADPDLVGLLILSKSGALHAIPPGVRFVGDIKDPETGERLIGDLDPKRHKARLEAAGLADVVTLRPDGTVEAKASKK